MLDTITPSMAALHLDTFERPLLRNSHDIEECKLGSKRCRRLKNWGVSIFIHEFKTIINITLQNKCKEQDIEICLVKIKFLERELRR
jgi:hypothetical protein